jgi:3-hydroxyisobutyrate dehydrogenase-like beta-hydroxyacid dehydrogenase
MKASFIGLGNMGAPMALNLLKGGVDLGVYNRNKEKAIPIVKAGAKLLEKPADAFAHAPIVFTMVANDEALHAITEGTEGLLAGAREGSVHVSLSTISPETANKLAALHKQKGVDFVSAPVFGRPDVAAKGALWICSAGEKEAKFKAEPFLKMLGKSIYDFGFKPEAANIVKLIGNFTILSVVEMLSEAFALAEKHGIETKEIYNLLTQSLYPSPVFLTYGKLILDQAFSPPGFQLPLGLKDINLFLDAAEAVDVSSPLANLLHDRLITSVAKGRGDLDWSAISMISRENAGLNNKSKGCCHD